MLFYLSAMWVEKSKYPRVDTGYAFTEKLNDELVDKFNNQTFTQGSDFQKYCKTIQKNYSFSIFPLKRILIKLRSRE